MAKDTMKAVIFKGPHQIALEDRPVPKIKDQTDIIVKVIYSALCGRSVLSLFFLAPFLLVLPTAWLRASPPGSG